MTGRHFSEHDSPGFLSNLAVLALNVANDRALAAHGVTGRQWTVLWLLAERRADTPNGLAAYLNVDTGAMSRLLARLRAKGLIEMSPHPSDRRSAIVVRTERAKALHPALRGAVAGSVARAFAGVEPDDLDTFKRTLLRAIENLDSGCVRPDDLASDHLDVPGDVPSAVR